MRRLILRTLAAFGFWHYFSSLQTIILVWLWVNWWSAITLLIFRLFWHSEKESVPLLHPKWYDRVQIVCIVHVRWKSKREPVGALCDKKERKSNKEFNPREYARVSYVISRAFFSTHRIRDLFHFGIIGHSELKPIWPLSSTHYRTVMVRSYIFSGSYKWSITFAKREFRQKACLA